MSYTATYSPEDNKLRLYAVGRLDDDTYKRVRAAGFIFAPKQDLFVAPMWTPEREDLLVELAGDVGDEDTSLVERAEERADRFEDYSEKRQRDADAAHRYVESITEHIPLGQPILVGHHSEKRARKDAERIESGMRRAVKMWETSQYWTDRAAGALRHAKYLERRDVRARRIKRLESELRKAESSREAVEKRRRAWAEHLDDPTKITRNGEQVSKLERAKFLANWDRGSFGVWSALSDGTMTPEAAQAQRIAECDDQLPRCGRWIAHYQNRLAYERAMLDEQGGLASDRYDIQPGGRVQTTRGGWVTVIRVNRKEGRIVSVTTNARYVAVVGIEKVTNYEPPTAESAAAVEAATKLPPMCNYPSDGCVEMTRDEWAKTWKDYKGSRVVKNDEHAAHRRRTVVRRAELRFVFITDDKRKDPPAKAAALIETPRPTIPPPTPALPAPRPMETPAPDPQAQLFAGMKASLKAGVQAVSAPQLFPTPPELVDRMVDLAELRMVHHVLEPSAGTGRITHEVHRRQVARLVAVEINGGLVEHLRAAVAFHPDRTSNVVVHGDFLERNGDLGTFDRIVMNPPFENAADVKHIRHALHFLKPGGRLVAICANGPRQAEQLRPIATTWEELPADTFKEQGTSVRTVLLTIDA